MDTRPAASGVVVGPYIFTPASASSSPDVHGSLYRDGTTIELRVTDSLLSELLGLLDTVQEELSRRWTGQEHSDYLTPCA
jgi:hypothetical protein